MKTVWKFELKHTIRLNMPKRAEILCVKEVEGVPVIYAEVETDNANNLEIRTFGVYYTGDPLPKEPPRVYIGTLMIKKLVYHFFEILE